LLRLPVIKVKLESQWKPRLAQDEGLVHERLVIALTQDILSGEIPCGARLPPHRDVASELGISVGTVTRAYATLQRQGLVKSEKGRGMFVATQIQRSEARLDLSVNMPPPIVTGRMLTEAINRLAVTIDTDFFTRYMSPGGLPEHRLMIARMVNANQGLQVEPTQVIMTNGAQQALFLAMSALPDGPLAIESLSFPGALRAARQLRRPLVSLPMDSEGILPDALEAALAGKQPPKLLYVVPTIQNPTGAVMGVRRRKAIAEIAMRHDLLVIEDDVYSVFAPEPMPPIAKFAPDHVLYASGFSKCLAPGLRVGYLVVPERFGEQAINWLMATQTMATPVSGLLLAHWMADGLVDSIARSIRAEARTRNKMVRELLAPWLGQGAIGDSLHAWLPMPTDRAREVVSVAAQAGIVLSPPDVFMSEPGVVDSGIRICLGAVQESQQLHEALLRLKDILQGGVMGTLGQSCII